MAKMSIQQQADMRKARGLAIAAAGKVHEDGHDHYSVESQAGFDPDLSYTVNFFAKTCTCPDFARHGTEFWCKHLYAVHVTKLATKAAPELAAAKGLTMEQLEQSLLYQLSVSSPSVRGRYANKLLVLLHAVQKQLQQQPPEISEPQRVELVTECRTSGGKKLPHVVSEELIQVTKDGEELTPRYDLKHILDWLMEKNYRRYCVRWLSRVGYVRRRQYVFVHD